MVLVPQPFEFNRSNITVRELDACLRMDFLCYAEKAFGFLHPGHRFDPNWHHQTIADLLMETLDGRCKRLEINLPPRHLKSFLISVAFVTYALGKDPTLQFICVSYSADLAASFSRDCRRIMQSGWYQSVFPQTRLTSDHNRENAFETTAGGGRLATSVGGLLTGLGADYIILDDLMKPQDALQPGLREKTLEWHNNTMGSRLDDPAKGVIINVQQRLHPADITGYHLARGGWKHLKLPAIATEDERFVLANGRVVGRRIGEALQPKRMSRADLDRLRSELGDFVFETQYQQNPQTPAGAMIDTAWFGSFDPSRLNRSLNCLIYQSWDTASTANELSDYSVGMTFYCEDGNYYLLDVQRVRLVYPQLRDFIVDHAGRYLRSSLIIENKGSGQSLLQEYTGYADLRVHAFNPRGDKVLRLQAVSPVIQAGRVLLPSGASWLRDFKLEMEQFPHGVHDDQVDALSQFLAFMDEQSQRSIFRRSF